MSALFGALRFRPSLVLAHTDQGYAVAMSRTFRRLGWAVYQAPTGPEARRLAAEVRADLVVLDVDLPGESGWLTCAKLTDERPGTRALLICPGPGQVDREFARFVGAVGIVPLSAGPEPLMNQARQIAPALLV